jgi:Na+/H+ antiporter NhaD/arsenite permease-like protein
MQSLSIANLAHAQIVIAWVVFLVSYFVFAVGHLPGTKVDRPSIAVIGAVLMVLFRITSAGDALSSVDFATIVLLFSMMLIVAALHLAGFFDWIAHQVIERLTPTQLLPGVIFTGGVLSAFLVNDVVCLFMTPLVLRICHRMNRAPLPFLLGLAMASNIGSTATITGNPQNILIGSVSQIGYMDFLSRLGPIAAVGLFIAWGVLHFAYRRDLRTASTTGDGIAPTPQVLQSPRAAYLWFPIAVTIAVLVGFLAGISPELVAATGAALVLLATTQSPRKVFAEVDWSLLVFFAGLFIIVGAAEKAGIAQHLLAAAERLNLDNVAVFTAVVAVLSNIVSNVPAVMLLKNVVARFPNPHSAWLILAMASTLAGNLTITGSIANIIVIEKARPYAHISFLQYLRIGLPVTVATLALGVIWIMVRR